MEKIKYGVAKIFLNDTGSLFDIYLNTADGRTTYNQKDVETLMSKRTPTEGSILAFCLDFLDQILGWHIFNVSVESPYRYRAFLKLKQRES